MATDTYSLPNNASGVRDDYLEKCLYSEVPLSEKMYHDIFELLVAASFHFDEWTIKNAQTSPNQEEARFLTFTFRGPALVLDMRRKKERVCILLESRQLWTLMSKEGAEKDFRWLLETYTRLLGKLAGWVNELVPDDFTGELRQLRIIGRSYFWWMNEPVPRETDEPMVFKEKHRATPAVFPLMHIPTTGRKEGSEVDDTSGNGHRSGIIFLTSKQCQVAEAVKGMLTEDSFRQVNVPDVQRKVGNIAYSTVLGALMRLTKDEVLTAENSGSENRNFKLGPLSAAELKEFPVNASKSKVAKKEPRPPSPPIMPAEDPPEIPLADESLKGFLAELAEPFDAVVITAQEAFEAAIEQARRDYPTGAKARFHLNELSWKVEP